VATFIRFPDYSVLKLDACLSQQHGRSADITKHKVETGASITDHIRPGPYTLTVNGLVAYAPPRDAIAVALGAFLGDDNRHVKAFERLMQAIDKSEIVKVETGLKVYENMAIRSVDSPREVKTGNDFVFTLQLEEIRFVEAATIKVPLDAFGKATAGVTGTAAKAQVSKTQRQAAPSAARGAAPKATPTTAQTTRSQSLLSRLTGVGA